MEKLVINHFKAFGSRIALIFGSQRKSLLLYGENGAGKTSVFEAIKLVFFRSLLLKRKISIGATIEQRQAEEESFYQDYQHKGDAHPIELELNDSDFKGIRRSDYQCFMLSNLEIENISITNVKDTINIKSLLELAYIDCDDVTAFLSTNISEILANVNKYLRNDFIEDFTIGQENTNFDIYIEDANSNLRASEGLHAVFNEAKLNLVRLLLLLTCVQKLKAEDSAVHKILVLDDVVTSLDASNRLYIIKFLLGEFADFQKIVLTHNIGFNNLFANEIKENGVEDDWCLENLYQTNNGANLYFYNELKTAKDIKREFSSGLLQPNTVGNEIRKRFEAIVLELSKFLQIEASATALSLTKRLVENNKPIYVYKANKKIYRGDDLVSDILSILNNSDSNEDKVQKVQAEIAKYQTNPNMQKIIPMIKEMKTYQKVMIHQLSHGSSANLPNFNQKEVEGSMLLLEQLENEIKLLKKDIGMM